VPGTWCFPGLECDSGGGGKKDERNSADDYFSASDDVTNESQKEGMGSYDLAVEAYNLLQAKLANGEDVSAVATSNVLDANNNPITDVTNGSPGEKMIGTIPAERNLWGGCCAETHMAAKIADALANGGSIEGENIKVGMAHASDVEPCRNCQDNLAALFRQYGKVEVSFFSYTETKGSGYDIWKFIP